MWSVSMQGKEPMFVGNLKLHDYDLMFVGNLKLHDYDLMLLDKSMIEVWYFVVAEKQKR
jgi:hypothetical protein